MPEEKLPVLLLCAFVHAAYLLFPCTLLHCTGVAGAPTGTHLPSIKPIANSVSAGVHIEHYYHHTGAEDHPGQNLIFVAPLLVFAPANMTCIA